MNQQLTPTDETLETGLKLLDKDLPDVYSFVGVQAERLEIAENRLEHGRRVPEWSDADAYTKVLSDQRAPIDDLRKYQEKGRAFINGYLKKLEPELRELLCKDYEVRKEVKDLESDSKTMLNFIAAGLVGGIAVNLPVAVAGAAASIATTLAVVVLKNKIEKFCKLGVNEKIDN